MKVGIVGLSDHVNFGEIPIRLPVYGVVDNSAQTPVTTDHMCPIQEVYLVQSQEMRVILLHRVQTLVGKVTEVLF